MSELFLVLAGIGGGYFVGYNIAASRAVDIVSKTCNFD